MPLTLKNFEAWIEAKIIQRGYDYYKRGLVGKAEQVGADEFSAVVFGSEDYEVFVKMAGERIIEFDCSCPYEWGDTCKHVVAVFFEIRSGCFPNNVGDKLNSILKDLSDKDLRDFVLNLLKRDRDFRQRFLREFDDEFKDEDDELFDEYYY